MRDFKKTEIIAVLIAVSEVRQELRNAKTLRERNEIHERLITLYACIPVDQAIEYMFSLSGVA